MKFQALTFLAIRVMIVLALIFVSGWQVMDQIEKFFNKKTTIASSIEPLETDDSYPSVSFCFGFKPDLQNDEILSLRNIKNWKQHQTLKEMNETFRRATYNLHEVLTEFSVGTFGNYSELANYKIGHERRFDNMTEVLEIYSEQGRCFSFHNKVPIMLAKVVKFAVKISRGHVICNIFYNHWGQSGLIDGYWNLEVRTVKLEAGMEYDFLMKKIVSKRLPLKQKCIPDIEVKDPNYNYLECLDNFAQTQLRKKLSAQGEKLCWIPQADYFIRLMNLTSIEACQTTKEMENLSHALKYAMSNAVNSDACKPPCTSAFLNVKKSEIMINKPDRNNISELFFQWEDENVIIEEEYLLMDLNAIVSAIGGSLGLFLGFSWLQVLLQMIQKIENWILQKP